MLPQVVSESGRVGRIIYANLKLQQLFNMAKQNGEAASISPLFLTNADSPILPFLLRPASSSRTRFYNREGHWSDKESIKYAIFLSYFQKTLEDPLKSSTLRIYDMMADMIITRDSRQCRNHHFKMLKYKTSIPLIIDSIACKYHPSTFQQISKQYCILIETLLYNQEIYIRNIKPRFTQAQHAKQFSVVLPSKPAYAFAKSTSFSPSEVELDKHQYISNELLKSEERIKIDLMKTKVSYFDSNDYSENGCSEEEIPIMRITDIKIEEQPEAPTRTDYLEELPRQTSIMGILEMEPRNESAEMRRMQLERQWHAMNIRHISSQILKEKQSIKYCESAIKLLQLTVEVVSDL